MRHVAAPIQPSSLNLPTPPLPTHPPTHSMALLVRWLLLCTGKLCENAPEVTAMALREQTHEMLAKLLGADNPDVRAAAVYTLGAFIQVHEGGGSSSVGSLGRLSPSSSMVGAASGVGPAPASGVGAEGGGAGGGGGAGAAAAAEGPLPEAERLAVERAIACALLEVVYDASPTVRCAGRVWAVGVLGRAVRVAASWPPVTCVALCCRAPVASASMRHGIGAHIACRPSTVLQG